MNFVNIQGGNALVNAENGTPIPLAMQRLDLSGRATPAGAMLRVTHSFRCEDTEPMEALYTFMLPRTGIVRRFVVKGENFEAESKLAPREEARKEYETGVEAGHLSVLSETNPDGMVTLSVGQVRPDETITVAIDIVSGVEVKDKSFRFRFPFTLAPSYHSLAKITATPGGGKTELPSDVFGDIILPEWKRDASGLHQVSFRMSVDVGGPLDSVSSPSHRILVRPGANGTAEIELAGVSDVPNRDLVIDVRGKEAVPTLFVDESLVGKKSHKDCRLPDGAPRWSVAIPSVSTLLHPKTKEELKRKMCFVLDCSGSMGGQPITRAILALKACLAALQPKDEFGLIKFGSTSVAFDPSLAKATETNRKNAAKFLGSNTNLGGTQLCGALGKAISVLGGSGGDIFLLTDGQVFGTGDILKQCVGTGTRIHVLGIGSASQDRFLASLARRTGGVERMVGVNEDVAGSALALFNAVHQPVRTDVDVSVSVGGKKTVQKHRVETVWDGVPIIIFDDGSTGKSIPSAVTLCWGKGKKDKVKVPIQETRSVMDGLNAILWAGQEAEDLDSDLDRENEDPAGAVSRLRLVSLSTRYGLATRVMSLVAVIHRVGDQAKDVVQKVVAVGVPEGMDADGVFGTPKKSGILRSCGFQTYSNTQAIGFDTTRGPLKSSVPRSIDAFSCKGSSDSVIPSSFFTEICDSGPLQDDRVWDSALNLEDPAPAKDLFAYLADLQDDGGIFAPNPFLSLVRTALVALLAHASDYGMGSDVGSLYGQHINRMTRFLNNRLQDETTKAIIAILEGYKPVAETSRLEEMLIRMSGTPSAADTKKAWTEVKVIVSVA